MLLGEAGSAIGCRVWRGPRGPRPPASDSNAVATTFGVLGAVSRRYAHRIPFIVKMNHNELLTLPNQFDQVMFGSAQQAWDLGAAGVPSLWDRRGEKDLSGRPLEVTEVGFADAVASAAVLVMGEGAEGCPAALVRGLDCQAAERPATLRIERPGQRV